MGACAAGRREGERRARRGETRFFAATVRYSACVLRNNHSTRYARSLYKHSLHSRQTTPYTHYAPQDKDHAGERGVVPTLRHEYERTQDP